MCHASSHIRKTRNYHTVCLLVFKLQTNQRAIFAQWNVLPDKHQQRSHLKKKLPGKRFPSWWAQLRDLTYKQIFWGQAGPHLLFSYLLFTGVALHVTQIAFHLQELGWWWLLRRLWCWVAWRWRWHRGTLRGRWGWIGWWWWRLGGGIGGYLILLGHVRANVWV